MGRRYANQPDWYHGATLGIGFVLALSGCGQSSGTVTGHVHYRSKPVAGGSVTFYGPDNQMATAPIKADGSYTATQVPLGTVKVGVISPASMSPKMASALQKMKKGHPLPPAPETVSLPPKYGKPDQSGLELTVSPGSQPFEIDLK